MSLTPHQFSALRYVAAHPAADAQTRYVGTRTAATLERLGLVTVEREISHHRVRVSPLSARTGTRMRPQCDESVTLTPAGRALLARANPGVPERRVDDETLAERELRLAWKAARRDFRTKAVPYHENARLSRATERMAQQNAAEFASTRARMAALDNA